MNEAAFKHEIAFFREVLRNSQSLIDEAKILFSNEYYRRSTFLAITAYEELMKIHLSLDNSTECTSLYSHRNKFPFMQPFLERMKKNFSSLEIDHEKIRNDHNIEYSNEVLEGFLIEIGDILQTTINPTKLRTKLLYHDKNDSIIYKLLANKKMMKTFAESFISLSLKTQEIYEDAVSEIEQSSEAT